MVQDGIALKKVADFLGHKDTRMVEKHYGHLDPDYQDEAIEVLDSCLGGVDVSLQKHLKLERASKQGDGEKGQNEQNPLVFQGVLMVEPDGIEPTTSTMPL